MLKDAKILVIVESPNKCSTISNILKKAGYSKATVMASYGHIMELANGGTYYNSGIEPLADFALSLKVSPDKQDIVKKLKAQVKAADVVYLMSDGDREGEAISWSLIKFLNIPAEKIRRSITHEITPKAVVQAIENPITLSEPLVDAALARLTIDKMIGYTLSPVAKAYVGAKSVGRCQSAGLKLIVDREKEIQDFKPEQYYDLWLQFIKNNTEFKAKYIGTEDNPIDKIKSTDLLKLIKFGCSADFTIKSIETKQKLENPKPPYCTATFQQDAANHIGLKVKDAMSCAQKLFEGISVDGEHVGLITYMRTDATDLSPEFLPELESYITNTFGSGVYTTPRVGKKSDNAQEGHEALRIVNPALTPDTLATYIDNDLLIKVYKLIWQRTIASALPAAVIAETTYLIENNKHLFKLTSKELLEAGYRTLYGTKEDSSELVKETFNVGEILQQALLQEQLKETQPPPRYKEATLIRELQKREIGRPSTYVTIVETVLSPTRNYCTLEDKCIVPTEKGIQLASFLDRSFSSIISLDYTKQLEESLDQIATSKVTKLDFLKAFHSNLEAALKANKETVGETTQAAEKQCPQCGAPMAIRRSRFGKLFYGCTQYPQCRGLIGID
jgi:DNA topoisomerase-1